MGLADLLADADVLLADEHASVVDALQGSELQREQRMIAKKDRKRAKRNHG